MRKVALTNGGFALVSDKDYASVMEFEWCRWRSDRGGYDYARCPTPGHTWRYMHRHVMGYPEGLKVDHRNSDGLDNRRSNLRNATDSQNQGNRRIDKDNVSGFKGVCLHKPSGRWSAYITCEGKRHYLGYHATPEAAAGAYRRAAKKFFKSFARVK